FGRGRVVLAQPPSLGADFQARLEDTRPLVAFYQLRRDLPRWAERLLTVRGVSASGRFDWSPGRLRFDDGFLPLPHGALRADADLEGTAKRARMLFTWRRLAAGVEVVDGRRELHLLRAREWWASCCEGR
ncbi:MAG TPA: hypothetical protein VMV46_13505, partial [Thermoanaerobaculia bacterium]|nr:hypothetical protein [Thermoanaerobaculia bacterium]